MACHQDVGDIAILVHVPDVAAATVPLTICSEFEVIISPSGRISDSSRELSDILQNRVELGEYVIGLSMFVMT